MKVLLFLCVFTVIAVHAQQCGRNEEYTTCGSSCQERCSRRANTVCTLNCQRGCFCRRGFLRNRNGVCVPESQCS
ncbi:Chymotrypsin-elastase inhibitor ixodidin-like Protein [Tribolium castaneum]|uniref:Chymotrypsin-elastase inhibitor ixodidin-like Protein n=1 Tax=Tribolium castaneum TaxID=7070 RepID=A0A139WLH9_TRICA|nr:Chymotrypsin-elastase inhibitor ixodidin-like Protein [Tribolium castaneum]